MNIRIPRHQVRPLHLSEVQPCAVLPRALSRHRLLLLVLFLLLLCSLIGGAAAAKRKIVIRSGPTQRSIEERGLLGAAVGAADLAEGAREYDAGAVGGRRFSGGAVLGYVTPWNRRGYEAAVRFRAKLTHVSPVWYQVRSRGVCWRCGWLCSSQQQQ